jgi:catechol 2,3-dioxygenase
MMGHLIEWASRHGAGNNAFCYFAGPEEFPIEYTAEVSRSTTVASFTTDYCSGRRVSRPVGITPHTARWK